MAQIPLEVVGGDELLDLLLDLRVGQAPVTGLLTGHWLVG